MQIHISYITNYGTEQIFSKFRQLTYYCGICKADPWGNFFRAYRNAATMETFSIFELKLRNNLSFLKLINGFNFTFKVTSFIYSPQAIK